MKKWLLLVCGALLLSGVALAQTTTGTDDGHKHKKHHHKKHHKHHKDTATEQPPK